MLNMGSLLLGIKATVKSIYLSGLVILQVAAIGAFAQPEPAATNTAAIQQEPPKQEFGKITWNGAFRYRYDMLDREDERTGTEYNTRVRQWAFLNLFFKSQVSEEVRFGGMIATGTDPRGAYQAFDNNQSGFAISLRRAFLTYTPMSVPGLSATVGAMENPFNLIGGSNLIFQTIALQGAAISYERKFGDFSIMPVVGQFVLDERTNGTDGQMLPGAQLGFKWAKNGMLAELGASMYDMKDLRGFDNATAFATLPTSPGNTTTGTPARFVYDYILRNYYLGFTAPIGKAKVMVYGDYVVNQDPENDNEGLLYGAKATMGSWSINHNQRYVQKDAVLSGMSWIDAPGTGYRSHSTDLGYKLNPAIELRAFYIAHKSIAEVSGKSDNQDLTKLEIWARF